MEMPSRRRPPSARADSQAAWSAAVAGASDTRPAHSADDVRRASPVYTYGSDGNGNHGRLISVSDPLSSRALTFAYGGDSSCALLTNGEVYCWGRNDHGQIGDQRTTDAVLQLGATHRLRQAAGLDQLTGLCDRKSFITLARERYRDVVRRRNQIDRRHRR